MIYPIKDEGVMIVGSEREEVANPVFMNGVIYR